MSSAEADEAWQALDELSIYFEDVSDGLERLTDRLRVSPGDGRVFEELTARGGPLHRTLDGLAEDAKVRKTPAKLRVLGLCTIPFVRVAGKLLKRAGDALDVTIPDPEMRVGEQAGKVVWKGIRTKLPSANGGSQRLSVRGFSSNGRIVESNLPKLPWRSPPFAPGRHDIIGATLEYNGDQRQVSVSVHVRPDADRTLMLRRLVAAKDKDAVSTETVDVVVGESDSYDRFREWFDGLVAALREFLAGTAGRPDQRPAQTGGPVNASTTVEQLQQHLEGAWPVVLQGPPGTGKTRLALQLIRRLAGVETQEWKDLEPHRFGAPPKPDARVVWEVVQLHPGYAYEDLVRGLRPRVVGGGGGVTFEPADGVLAAMAREAARYPEVKYVLVLDEINRCNLSAVLGELILALEPGYRGLSVRLQYTHPDDAQGDRLALPKNLWIIGTMNTADRSIAMVDLAIRRRFRFLDVSPDAQVIRQVNGPDAPAARAGVAAFEALGKMLREPDRPRLAIGHSYFLVPEGKAGGRPLEALADRLVFEVFPLLREYEQEGYLATSELRFGGDHIEWRRDGDLGGLHDAVVAALRSAAEATTS